MHLNSVNNKLNFLRTHLESTSLSLSRSCSLSFPPANEVWGKVICLQACVCPQGGVHRPGRGVCSGGVPRPRGVPGLGGCLLQGMPPSEGVCYRRGWGGACSRGVCVETPPKADSYCYGRYASYWNAILFSFWAFDCKSDILCLPSVSVNS